MRVSAIRLLLRSVAVAIAIAALFDPVWTVSRPVPREVIAIDLSAGGSDAIDRLRDTLPESTFVTRRPSGAALPCAPNERCVMIADGSIDVNIPSDLSQPLSLVTVDPARAPNVAIRTVLAVTSHAAAAGVLRVELARDGDVAATELRVFDGAAVVGGATHHWDSSNAAGVDVTWWPLDSGIRALRVEAVPIAGESTIIDNYVDVAAPVATGRASVLVFDARPSWSSTFVRRALEDDPRFNVGHRARVAPSISAGTAKAGLDAPVLDLAAVVIVGGPDALTAGDAALLHQFVTVRGGTLILLPDQRLDGPLSRMIAGRWSEHFAEAPRRVGPLWASEILTAADLSIATVLAVSDGRPSIVSLPLGNGRVIVSGAMDAWRHRDRDDGGFDRFWRTLAVEGAAASASPSISFDTQLLARGSKTRFVVRDRRLTPAAEMAANATLHCGDDPATIIRLWPDGSRDFVGEVSAAAGSTCAVEAVIADRRVRASFIVASQPSRGVRETLDKLTRAVRRSGGVVAFMNDEGAALRRFDQARQVSSQVVSTRPMRAFWWMIPFAGCLTAEWWLRRREGLR